MIPLNHRDPNIDPRYTHKLKGNATFLGIWKEYDLYMLEDRHTTVYLARYGDGMSEAWVYSPVFDLDVPDAELKAVLEEERVITSATWGFPSLRIAFEPYGEELHFTHSHTCAPALVEKLRYILGRVLIDQNIIELEERFLEELFRDVRDKLFRAGELMGGWQQRPPVQLELDISIFLEQTNHKEWSADKRRKYVIHPVDLAERLRAVLRGYAQLTPIKPTIPYHHMLGAPMEYLLAPSTNPAVDTTVLIENGHVIAFRERELGGGQTIRVGDRVLWPTGAPTRLFSSSEKERFERMLIQQSHQVACNTYSSLWKQYEMLRASKQPTKGILEALDVQWAHLSVSDRKDFEYEFKAPNAPKQ